MQIVQSRLPSTRVKVPIGAAGFEVQFADGRAVVPDEVADVLIGMGGGFYHVRGPVLPALKGARVLIIRDTGLGDMLLLTPLIRKLATTAKVAATDVLTHERYRCLFEGNPHMRRTYALEREGECDRSRYDVVLDLRLVVENAEAFGLHRHRADAFAAYADVVLTEAERRLDCYLAREELESGAAGKLSAQRAITPDAAGTSGVIGYVWRASVSNRSWSSATHSAVVGALAAAGFTVVVLDHEPQDAVREIACHVDHVESGAVGSVVGPVLDFTGKTTIREMAAILAQCDAVICPDTGLFHLAGALGVPTLTYFGAFPVEERQAHTNLTVLNDAPAHCALAPCRSYRCLNRDGEGEAHCLTVVPNDVVAAVRGAIAKGAHQEAAEEISDDRVVGPANDSGAPSPGQGKRD